MVVQLLFSTALAWHFMGSYGVLIDPGMLVNAMQTDWREAGALRNWQLFAGVAGLVDADQWDGRPL